jgi:Phage minor capsid protein 2
VAAPSKTRARRRARPPAITEPPVITAPELALAYAALEIELSDMAQKALVGGRIDTVRGRRQYQRAAKSLIAHLRADARPRVQALIEAAYGDGARLAGARPPGAILRATIDELAQGVILRLDGSLDTVGRQFDDVFRQVGLQQASRQLTRELPRQAAADLMAKELQSRGLTGFVDRAGRRWRLATYSDMALRTTAAEAANRGVAEAMSATGRDLVRVNRPEGHDCTHHPNDPDNPCRKLEGKVLSLFGQTPGVPVLEKLPPFHPYCAHFVAPASEGP